VSRIAPLLSFLAALAVWQLVVTVSHEPEYLVPGPLAIAAALLADPAGLLQALFATLTVTAAALVVACVVGVAVACAMASNAWARALIKPWAVILQVTPVVAVAPLIIVWIGNPFAAMVVCATIVAFFPIFSNTVAGLEATPQDVLDLFRLTAPAARRRFFCCVYRQRCHLCWRDCGFRAGSPRWVQWWRNS
jgi:NitT/TauT family transport system permease protein